MLDIAPKALAPDVLPPKKGFYRRIEQEPLGIVLDIAVWTYLQVRDGSTPVINAISFLLIVGTSLLAMVNLYFGKKEA